jgi:hypothetical protein
MARKFILRRKRTEQTAADPASTATTGRPRSRTAGIRRMIDCHRDRHRSGGRPIAPGSYASSMLRHDARDLPTLFRGGDDPLVASRARRDLGESSPGVQPCLARARHPATIRNSTLLFPAIPKNAPCSLARENSFQHLKNIRKLDRQRIGSPCNF